MKVEIVAYSKLMNGFGNPMSVCEQAASVCYDSKPTESYAIAKSCLKSGHMSVMEHISFTFHISGVSRALLAQLSRHRHISLSVRSQRYCNESRTSAVYPKTVESVELDAGISAYGQSLGHASATYGKLLRLGVPAEDARMILPNAYFTEMYLTANARSLIEMSHLRLCMRSQWEIRDLFEIMKSEVEKICPEVAEAMRPKCEIDPEHPFCTEAKCCGRQPKLEEVYAK